MLLPKATNDGRKHGKNGPAPFLSNRYPGNVFGYNPGFADIFNSVLIP